MAYQSALAQRSTNTLVNNSSSQIPVTSSNAPATNNERARQDQHQGVQVTLQCQNTSFQIYFSMFIVRSLEINYHYFFTPIGSTRSCSKANANTFPSCLDGV